MPSSVSLLRATPRPAKRLEVFGVLHELGLAEQPGQSFDRVHQRALGERILALRVQAVHGVHHHRNARDPRRDAAVQPRLRVVRVHDRGPEPAEDRDQLGQRPRVLRRRERAGAVVQRDVPDAARFEGLDVRPGRHADHLEAGRGERFELRTERPLEADVGRGHVDHERPGLGHVCAFA